MLDYFNNALINCLKTIKINHNISKEENIKELNRKKFFSKISITIISTGTLALTIAGIVTSIINFHISVPIIVASVLFPLWSFNVKTFIHYNACKIKVLELKSELLQKQIRNLDCPENIAKIIIEICQNFNNDAPLTKYKEALLEGLKKDSLQPLASLTVLYDFFKQYELKDQDIAEIIAFYFSKNYTFFNGKHNKKYKGGLKSKEYFAICKDIEIVKQFINENGEIVPNNISLDEISNKDNLDLPLELIIKESNRKYQNNLKRENDIKEKQEKLNNLLISLQNNPTLITTENINIIKKLMSILNYSQEEINNEKKDLLHLLNQQKAFKAEEYHRIQKEREIIKKSNLQSLMTFMRFENNELVPLRYLNNEEIEFIKTLLKELYTNNQITAIINRIHKFNRDFKNNENSIKLNRTKNALFNIINQDEETVHSLDVNILYENAVHFINNHEIDSCLEFYKTKLEELINTINSCIFSMIDNINDDDLLEIKIAFLEIDNCFNDIYSINPSIRKRLE